MGIGATPMKMNNNDFLIFPQLKKCPGVRPGHVVIAYENKAMVIDIGNDELENNKGDDYK